MRRYDRIKAVVSLDAIAHNFGEMKKNIAKGTKIIAVIKADGYGHGAEAIARLIHGYSYIWGFAVATAEEALQLRAFGVTKPILILGIVFEEYFPDMVEQEIRLTVSEYSMAEKLSEEAVRQGKTVHIHIGLDTGMSRIGFSDTTESVQEIKKITELSNVEVEGLFTHFARADETDISPAEKQLERYVTFERLLHESGIRIPVQHCSNSAGIAEIREANMDMVRAGITLYGLWPSEEVDQNSLDLKPVMELKTKPSAFCSKASIAVSSFCSGRLIMRDSTKPTAIICTVSHRPLPCGWVHSAKVSSRYATHPMTAKAPVCGSFKISSRRCFSLQELNASIVSR